MAVVMLVVCVLASIDAVASSRVTNRIKAAFIFNFIKFTEWPQDVRLQTINVCVRNDAGMYVELQGLKNKRAHGVPLEIIQIDDESKLSQCQVIYFGEMAESHLDRVLSHLAGRSILTIGDHASFIQQGGGIRLFLSNNRLRFEISPVAVNQSQLVISSKLLSLSRKSAMHGGAGQ
ncbi:MAG: YfiR family protein [Gammaproteobacteria bacterium]